MSGVVVIKTENGPVRIDATDYDEKHHELHVADEHYDEDGIARNVASLAPMAQLAAAVMAAPDGTDTGSTGSTTASIEPGRNYDAFGVMQVKTKFFIVDGANGGKVVDNVEGINPKGYPDNATAWGVLLALKAKPATDNA